MRKSVGQETLNRNERRRSWWGLALSSMFLTCTLLPGTLVAAAPAIFTRVGPGVSGASVASLSFDAPQFGDVSEAVNVASGNVYIDLGQLNHNNLSGVPDMSGASAPTPAPAPTPTPTPAPTPTPTPAPIPCKPTLIRSCVTTQPVSPIGARVGTTATTLATTSSTLAAASSTPVNTGSLSGGYSVTGVMKLNGFSQSLTTQPQEWAMGGGDGGASYFRRATTAEIGAAPSWINDRYLDVQASTTFFISKPQNGVQTDETWIVSYRRADGTTVAHSYDHVGNRTTFWGDGEYADFSQTLAQQYRSAKYVTDPDGTAVGSPRTEFTYVAGGAGHLQKVKDEWDRVTTYNWDANGLLVAVNLLLSDESRDSSYARRIEYGYAVYAGQWQVDGLSFRTYDGHKQPVARYVSLQYLVSNGETLLSKITRPVLGGDQIGKAGLVTSYRYDTSNRVVAASTLGEPDTVFSYGQSTSATGAGGVRVTQTQGVKTTVYEYSPEGWLRNVSVRDYNPLTTADYNPTAPAIWNGRNTMRWYDATGRIVAMSLPGGSQVQNIYDQHGDIKQASIYSTPVIYAVPAPSGAVRTTNFEYNIDNYQTAALLPSTSGTSGGTSYSYAASGTFYIPTYYPTVTANGRKFRMMNVSDKQTWVNNTRYSRVISIFDEYGRMTEVDRVAPGLDILISTYVYYPKGSQRYSFQTDTPWKTMYDSLPPVIQYGDQLANQTVGGVYTSFGYDEYGNRVSQITGSSHVYKWDGPTASYGQNHHVWAYNGFGQPVWEVVWEYQNFNKEDRWPQMMAKGWQYYSSGELDSSWEGNPGNVTDYRYIDASASTDFGRLAAVVLGEGAQGGITTPHKTTTLAYDSFGRAVKSVTDGFTTTTTYDTLDRPVRVSRPDNSRVDLSYNGSGKITTEVRTETNGSSATTIHDFNTLDQETKTTFQDGNTVLTSYDPYDRPIKVTDNRLTMNAAGADRSTYLVYDDLGNLIKKLSPALVTTGQQYTDARRPYSEYGYDNFGRQTSVSTLLYGKAVTPTSMSLDAGTVATTRVQYDAFDRPTKVTDPSGYTTDTTYDNSGNAVKVVRQAWTGSEPDYSVAAPSTNSVTTYAAYDAMGHPVQSVDARGGVRKMYYNVLGQPTMQVDARNVVTKVNWYTADGLLDSVWEPKLDGTAAPTDGSFAYGNGGGVGGFAGSMFPTEHYLYGTRVYPSTVERAVMNSSAYGSPNSTSYVYDDAGRPINITLPAANSSNQTTTLSKSYDSQGNVLTETDASGFPTSYSYNWAGRLLSKNEQARPGNSVDSNAGLGNGLQSSYRYDAAGNLTSKTERGLSTTYQYNSLGKVIAESRPHTNAVGDQYWKLSTYRLDGLKTAQTTYDYNGGLAQTPAIVAASQTTAAIVSTQGNVTIMEYNTRGDQTAEMSYKSGPSLDYVWYQDVNGLGARYKRQFSGNEGIYAEQRTAQGVKTGNANYLTYWRSDLNGNLTEKWDTPAIAGWGWYSLTALNAGDRQNVFNYSYSPTNKELSQSRNVQVRVQSRNPSDLSNTASTSLWNRGGGYSGILLADTVASTTSAYTPRDQLSQVDTTEQLPVVSSGTVEQSTYGAPASKTTYYGYYADGRLQSVGVSGKGTRSMTYDTRGRETSVSAPEGTTITVWSADGTRKDSFSQPNTCTKTNRYGGEVDYPCPINRSSTSGVTVGGLAGDQASTAMSDDYTATNTSHTYTPAGLLDKTIDHQITAYGGVPYDVVTDNVYNEFGQSLSSTTHVPPVSTSNSSSPASDTLAYSAGYNTAGNVTTEYKADPGSSTKGKASFTYALDSRGNRVSVSGGSYNGAIKRYTAEGKAAQFYVLGLANFCGFWSGCNGTADKYNDFRYDPNGAQVLTSVAGIEEGRLNDEYAIFRDVNSVVLSGSEIQYTFRRAGQYSHQYKWYTGCGSDCFTDTQAGSGAYRTYATGPYVFKDNTYSFAVGYNDSTAWTGVVPFALPSNKVRTLQAPVTALSNRLRINPLDVKPTSGLPRLADPSKVTDGSRTGTDAVAAQPGGTQAAVPAPSAPSPEPAAAPTSPAPVQAAPLAPVANLGLGMGAQIQGVQNLPPVDPGAVRNGALAGDGRVSDSAPDQAARKPSRVFAAEVSADFNDGSGFKYPVYAQDVRALDWSDFVKWWQEASAKSLAAQQMQSKASYEQAMGDLVDRTQDSMRNVALKAMQSDPRYAKVGVEVERIIKFVSTFDDPMDKLNAYSGVVAILDRIKSGTPGTDPGYLSAFAQYSTMAMSGKMDRESAKDNIIAMGSRVIDNYYNLSSSGMSSGLAVATLFAAEEISSGGLGNAADGAGASGAAMHARTAKAATVGKKVDPALFKFLQTPMGRIASGLVKGFEYLCGGRRNSFTPSTPVRTLIGLVAINALTVGMPVLAFDESTQQNGYYPITAVHKNLDSALTYLTLNDGKSGQPEAITTTPEHPFYVQVQADTQTRPRPIGHEDLNSHWVGAGHLQIGDKIREADGTVGIVANVVTVQQTQEMFNLTVDTAHTFYVGESGWLVHNENTSCLMTGNGMPRIPNSPTGAPPASAPKGRLGSPLDVPRGTNIGGVVDRLDFSGHAFDQMQGRGIPPSVVGETIAHGTVTAGRNGTWLFTDAKNGIQVLVNATTSKIITVITK